MDVSFFFGGVQYSIDHVCVCLCLLLVATFRPKDIKTKCLCVCLYQITYFQLALPACFIALPKQIK